jgi:single-stranded DNA-binding protein
VAVSGRREQEASFFTVIVWRDQAEHAAQSLSKSSRVVVMGRLQQRRLVRAGPHGMGKR